MRTVEAIMIRTADGRYWLNHTDDDGIRRSSYLGNIGHASAVATWCEAKGIEFRQTGRATSAGSHKSAERKFAPVS